MGVFVMMDPTSEPSEKNRCFQDHNLQMAMMLPVTLPWILLFILSAIETDLHVLSCSTSKDMPCLLKRGSSMHKMCFESHPTHPEAGGRHISALKCIAAGSEP